MFEVDKPRRFHYEPRFYDPEKEKWEALKKKYAIEQERQSAEKSLPKSENDISGTQPEDEKDLAYFQQRVRALDHETRQPSGLTWRDLFRKREMPKFNYKPRFNPENPTKPENAEIPENPEALVNKYRTPKHRIKIHRRFDIADPDYMKPISGTKIILYTAIVCLLLAIIFLL